jgi:DNA invertase Pin-like site-specific DNA recombinase
MSALIPAAQYLRMSTDQQQYSLANQADAIAHYAVENGFRVVKTYSDAARSGLTLRRRSGLKRLLKEVVEGKTEFRAILVYDVSRWGRFQDVDEAAHYEYLCKSSSIPVHYCAETFTNDGTMPALIMKALKRTMAGEYSRELSLKVRAGLERLAKLGYKMGGMPPYGLRRLLLDTKDKPKQILSSGEYKSLTTEHVIFVPGPPNETAVVRRIFDEFANRRRTLRQIAKGLNDDAISYIERVNWNANTVRRVLRHAAYAGIQVWGRRTEFLGGPTKPCPREKWVVCPGAFEPVVGIDLFEKAQRIFENFTHNLSDEEMLARLGPVLERHGKLTSRIIDQSGLCPGARAYHCRFGGMLKTYARLGYQQPQYFAAAAVRQRTMLLRQDFMESVVREFPGQFQVVRRSPRCRTRLRYRTGLIISVVFATRQSSDRGGYWLVGHPEDERKRVTVLALMNDGNSAIHTLLIMPTLVYRGKSVRLTEGSKHLDHGLRLESVASLLDMLLRVRALRGDRSGRGSQ